MEKEKTSMINKENISDYVARSVMITAMEGAFEVLNIANYPLSPETKGSAANRAALLRALDADIKDFNTPFLKNVVSRSKILSQQGGNLRSVMFEEEMDELIEFAEERLGLSLCMLREVRSVLAMGEELGERAFKRERYSEVRYLDFFQQHPITENKMVETIRFTFYMSYMEGVEVLKKASEELGYKLPERLDIESGSMEDVLASGDLRAAMWQPYIRASKCAGKANFAGLLMPVVDKGIAKFSAIHNFKRDR